MNPQDFYLLIVDDEEGILNTLEDLLKDVGYNVSTATSAEEAIQKMQDEGLPHIVLTDIRMPGLSGIEFTEKIKKEFSQEVIVIIMTSHASLETAIEALRLGAYDYLHKPFQNLDDVRTLIQRATRVIYKDQLIEFQEQQKNQIMRFGENLSKITDPEKIVESTQKALMKFHKFQKIVFFEYIEEQYLIRSTVPHEFQISLLDLKAEIESDSIGFFSELQQNDQIKEIISKKIGIEYFSIYPCFSDNAFKGLFVLSYQKDEAFYEDSVMQYLSYFSVNFEKSRLLKKITEMAIKDGLTGLYNVRFFRENFQRLLTEAKNKKEPISILFFDVDNFKNYNDTNGHQLGDEVLKLTAKLLKETFQEPYIPARYGGEEFIVLLPQTGLEKAYELGEYFRQLLREFSFPKEELQPCGFLSVSIGVAEYPTHADEAKHLIECADESLYFVKETGRNGCVIAQPMENYHPSWTTGYIPAANEVVAGQVIADLIEKDIVQLNAKSKRSDGNRLLNDTKSPLVIKELIKLPNPEQLKKAHPPQQVLKEAILDFLKTHNMSEDLYKPNMELNLFKKPFELLDNKVINAVPQENSTAPKLKLKQPEIKSNFTENEPETIILSKKSFKKMA